MTDSKLLSDIVENTIKDNPELVEQYVADTHGALNDLLAASNEYGGDTVSQAALATEFKKQLN